MDAKNKKILIIEDNWNELSSIVEKNKAGLCIMPENQNEHTKMIEKLQTTPFEYIENIIKENSLNLRCIICDLKLVTNIEGADIIKHIRQKIKIKHCPLFTNFIPIIIWTSHSNKQITKTALTAGADFVIAKTKITAQSDNYFWDIVEQQCERFEELCKENEYVMNKRFYRPRSDKPKIFIGSSSAENALEIANAVREGLKDIAYCKIWNNDVFPPGDNTIDTLTKIVDEFDYSVFIFHDDDTVFLRKDKDKDKEEAIPRDNVIFEYGMFLSKHGKKRTFFVVPVEDSKVKIHIMTDIMGVTRCQYGVKDMKGSGVKNALNDVCWQIKKKIQEIEEL